LGAKVSRMVLPDCLEAVWHSRYESRSIRVKVLKNPLAFRQGSVKPQSHI
jgi:hypothetical protein